MNTRTLVLVLGWALLGVVGCFEDTVIDAHCPPESEGCGGYDYDGDGVANDDDDFPSDGSCSVVGADNCTACGVGCAAQQVCDVTSVHTNGVPGGFCVCLAPHFALPDCTSCLPKYTGAGCEECTDQQLTGPSCDEVIIAPGTFTMGSPESEPCRLAGEAAHEVTLTRPFALKMTEVTQAEWEALMGNNPSQKSAGCDGCPVQRVNWYEALAYCNALSTAAGLEACYTLSGCQNTPGNDMECTDVTVTAPDGDVYGCEGYRLPTEAEWEYAARAGTTEATYNGDIAGADCTGASPVLAPIAWYSENSGSTTHPVAQKDANPWGLYDMLGNVWEWTWDPSSAYPGDVTDPVGSPTGSTTDSYRVLRGGSWYLAARFCRAAERHSYTPERAYNNLGFRTARTLP